MRDVTLKSIHPETNPMPMAAHTLPPPLRQGERLTRDEFMRRWEAMPDLKHAELIDGIVYIPSMVTLRHATHHSDLCGWLGHYEAGTPACSGSVKATWLMDEKNVPGPTLRFGSCPSSEASRDWTAIMWRVPRNWPWK